MSRIKSELSKKNGCYIEKHRFLELKHFCLQYPIWKKALSALDGLAKRPADLEIFEKNYNIPDPTARCAMAREYYKQLMYFVDDTLDIMRLDNNTRQMLLTGVTENKSYDQIGDVSISRHEYYKLYREFFYILNFVRDTFIAIDSYKLSRSKIEIDDIIPTTR